MNFTARMASLLGAMCRERNGAVADTMFSYGKSCGLNYGVSLSTVRKIARMETPDHDYARYLWQQDVRELRLAALHLAQPERITSDEFGCWASGIINSELAEEAAFVLLNRIPAFSELFDKWLLDAEPLMQYAFLMAASRRADASLSWIEPTMAAVRRNAETRMGNLVSQGAVALLAVIGSQNEKNRHAVLRAADSPEKLPTEDFVHEELSWRI